LKSTQTTFYFYIIKFLREFFTCKWETLDIFN